MITIKRIYTQWRDDMRKIIMLILVVLTLVTISVITYTQLTDREDKYYEGTLI